MPLLLKGQRNISFAVYRMTGVLCMQVSLSSEVMQMVKMVPRGFTATADAYLTPHIMRCSVLHITSNLLRPWQLPLVFEIALHGCVFILTQVHRGVSVWV